ncbi:conjugal transfer protein [Bailinhaonella thermotolerans]|nr:conjugal transfer protein [Bailinhaonella thermotolerans]
MTRQPSGQTGTVTSTSPDSGFPTSAAAAFATQFAGVYLNFDGEKPEDRSASLAPFLPEGAQQQFGWNANGRMSAGAIQVHEVTVRDADNATVVLAALVNGRRMLLSVPVYRSGGEKSTRFVVAGLPALLPAPKPAPLAPPPPAARDGLAEAELKPQLRGFFEAYAEGDPAKLQRFLASGVLLDGLGNSMVFAELKDVVVPPGGSTREVNATVVWRVPAPGATGAPSGESDGQATLEQTYALGVEKQGDKWYVRSIGGAARAG